MLVLVHNNPVRIVGDRLLVDRKFAVGLAAMVRHLDVPVTTVHPALRDAAPVMDAVEWPLRDLPYQVLVLETSDLFAPAAAELARLRALIGRSQLVAGYGFRCEALAREAGVPYIMVLEYDLATQVAMATEGRIRGPRDVYRALWCVRRYWLEEVPAMRRAHSLHCNGYPVYEATRRVNARRLLYLDSRMSRSEVIPEAALEARLASRPTRAFRLLFSGRYEAVKGALDAVRAAVAVAAGGVALEFEAYGQGSLRESMRAVAAATAPGAHVRIGGVLAFAELMRLGNTFDACVLANVQGDPSCTYIEAMGCGLPVVGYANTMWSQLHRESGAGVVVPARRIERLAEAITQLASDPERLAALSRRARAFAAAHSQDEMIASRTEALNSALRARHDRRVSGESVGEEAQ